MPPPGGYGTRPRRPKRANVYVIPPSAYRAPKPRSSSRRAHPVGVFAQPPLRSPVRRVQRQARRKVRKARAQLPPAPRPAIPQIARPTPAQQRHATRLVQRSHRTQRRKHRADVYRQEALALHRLQAQANARSINLERAGRDPRFALHARRTGLLTTPEVASARRSYLRARHEPLVDVGKLVKGAVTVMTGGATPKKGKGRRAPGATAQVPNVVFSIPKVKAQPAQETARKLAPALPVLEQLNRPIHGVAGGARQVVKDVKAGRVPSPEKVAQETWQGVTLEDKNLFSDVLKEAGVQNKTVRALAGFGLDVALDPTTYVTLGTASVATKAAAHAAERVAVSATKAKYGQLLAEGVGRRAARSQAKETGRRAAAAAFKQTLRKHPQGPRGVTVSIAGGRTARRAGRAVRRRVLPQAAERRIARRTSYRRGAERKGPPAFTVPLTYATAKARGGVAAGAQRLGRTAVGGKVSTAGQVARQIGAGVHAGIRPAGVSRRELAEVKAVRREARAQGERLIRRSASRANALLGRLAKDERELVIDAVEANDLKRLKGVAQPRTIRGRVRRDPDRLLKVGKQVRDELRYRHRVESRTGALYSEVGARSRGRAELDYAAQAGRALPKLDEPRQALIDAETNATRAGAALRAAGTRSARIRARRAVREADVERAAALRRYETAEEQHNLVRHARAEQRRARGRRLEGEARGYFPHVAEEETEGAVRRILRPALPERVRKPADTVKARAHRESLAEMREGLPQQQATEQGFTKDVRQAMAQAGAGTARKAQAATANRKLVETLGRPLYVPGRRSPLVTTPELGREATREASSEIRAMTERGESVYRLRGSELHRLGLDDAAEISRAARGRPTPGGGRYVILRDRIVEQATKPERTLGGDIAPLVAFDAVQGAWKGFVLTTPQQLVRNFLGDLYNAFGRENAWRLVYNVGRGQRGLGALGRLERAERRHDTRGRWLRVKQALKRVEKAERDFEANLDPKLRMIRLTPEQAREIAGQSGERLFQIMRRNPKYKDLTKQQVQRLVERNLSQGKVPALALAQHAERMGVVRQGRFLELMQEGRMRATKGGKWEMLAKRVEDSVRIGTWLGGLQRGMSPRRAADRASEVHFDYGDLTPFEKGVSRRLMPFYTFTSRNLPLQAKTLATRPGKIAVLGKAREEARRAAGLPEGYEQNLDEFEARQLGIPIRFGDRVVTLSVGSPFVDLNDIARIHEGPRAIAETVTRRGAEMIGPLTKLAPELVFNYSAFYRDQIQPDEKPETRAPDWAVIASRLPGGKRFAKLTGLTTDWLDTATGERAPGWNKKADYFFKNVFSGPGRVALEGLGLGAPTLSARQQTEAQRRLGLFGVRARTYDVAQGTLNRMYDEQQRVQARMDRLNGRAHPTARQPDGRPVPINADNPTPEYSRLLERNRRLGVAIDALQRKTRPKGIVKGRPVAPSSRSRGWPTPAGGSAVPAGGWPPPR